MDTESVCKLVASKLSADERAYLWKAVDNDPNFAEKMIRAITGRNHDDAMESIATMLAHMRWYMVKLGRQSVVVLATSQEAAEASLLDALNLGDRLNGV